MAIPMLFRFSLYGFLKNQQYYQPFIILAFICTAAVGIWVARLTEQTLSNERLISNAGLDQADLTGGPALFPRHVTRWFLGLWVVFFLVCLWFSLFVAFWLFDLIGARTRTTPWSTTPAFIKACLSTALWLFTIGLFLAMSAGFVDLLQQPSAPEQTRTVLLAAISAIPYAPWMGLSFVVGLILNMTIAMRFEHRQYENWGCLDVESE